MCVSECVSECVSVDAIVVSTVVRARGLCYWIEKLQLTMVACMICERVCVCACVCVNVCARVGLWVRACMCAVHVM